MKYGSVCSGIEAVLSGERQWAIVQGHVMDLLRAMPDESVQTVCTSPPYWGLRTYSTEEQVWGGDAECEHEWQFVGPRRYRTVNDTPNSPLQNTSKGSVHNLKGANLCTVCGAWFGELGLEPTPTLYVQHIVELFREVWRVLRKDGTLWLNLGDSYVAGPTGNQDISSASGKAADMFAKGGRYRVDNLRKDAAKTRQYGLRPKNLVGVPWRVAFGLQEDGWILRSEITWCKRAPMPESVQDRPTSATEKIFLFAKSERYFYDADAIREPAAVGELRGTFRGGGSYVNNNSFKNSALQAPTDTGLEKGNTETRNAWNYMTHPWTEEDDAWLLSPEPLKDAHFATFPSEIPRRAILAGTSERGCCAACGAPWRRAVERKPMVIARSDRGQQLGEYGRTASSGTMPQPAQATTMGWQPTCLCQSLQEPVGCVVLDPFSGSGTTGMVTLRLGRRYVGFELNPDYVAMSERRIIGDAPLFNGMEAIA